MKTWCTMHAEEALKIGRVGDDDVRIQMHRGSLAHPVGQGGGRVARSGSNSKADLCNACDLRASNLGQLAVLCCIRLVGGSSKRMQVCVLLMLLFFLLLQASFYFRRKSDQWRVSTTTNLTGLETRKMHGYVHVYGM